MADESCEELFDVNGGLTSLGWLGWWRVGQLAAVIVTSYIPALCSALGIIFIGRCLFPLGCSLLVWSGKYNSVHSALRVGLPQVTHT